MANYKDDRGQLELERAQDLLTTKVTGYLSVKLAQHIVDEMKQGISSGRRLSVAHDWHEMTNYEGDVRSLLTNFSLANRKAFGAIWILLKSPMVSMGVNTAAIALRPAGIVLNSTTNPDVFREKLNELTSRKAA